MAIQEGTPFKQHLSQQVWMENYKWETDETVWDTFRRVARFVASVEKDKKQWEEKYYKLLSEFKYIPGGRIISNAGTGLKKTTLINCYVSGFRGERQDSVESIYQELGRQACILASEGGYGCNFDVLRPKGSFVNGIGVETSGVLHFMNIWDTSSDTLTKGSGRPKKDGKGKNKIRKGAMMGMLSSWHPAIEEFIIAKQQPGMLTKFNLTVLATDDFIDAVKKHTKWQLKFPDTTFEKYDLEWDGDIAKWEGKGYPINVWKEYVDANELWDLIIESTYKRNEPGIAFIDRVNELNNLYYAEKITASNPCVTGDTLIETTEGRISIKEMAESFSKTNKTYDVYSVNMKTGKLEIKPTVTIFKTKTVNTIIKITLSNDTILKCTEEHKIYNKRDRNKYAVSEIKEWFDNTSQSSQSKFRKYIPIMFQRIKASEKYLRVKVGTQRNYVREHRFISAYYFGKLISDEYNVHHINGDTFNNSYSNLEIIPHGEHSKLTNKGHRDWSDRSNNGRFKNKRFKVKKVSISAPEEILTRNNERNVYFSNIEILNETWDVYDMTVLDNHNYIANGICISNCGEQYLPIKGSCNLGAINLTQYISEKRGDFDFESLKEDMPTIVRFQDSIIDLTNYPLNEQLEEAKEKRRCGIGYMGYGSALYLLKQAYGNEATLKLTTKLIKFITNQIYQASSDLAEEKGSFPAFDCENYLKSKFVKQALTESTIEKIRQQGIRNSHLTTVAPTGNTGLFANNCSGGLEPVVSAIFTRTVTESNPPVDLILPINIDWDLHIYEVENGWSWTMEGDEWILKKEYDRFAFAATQEEVDKVSEGKEKRYIVYKIDRNRGLTREEEVYDYATLLMGADFDEKAEYAKNIFNLKVEEHIETMKVFARYIDSSISKTINVPNNYSYEEFKDVYMKAYDSGYIKGVTTYREGTMASVLSVKSSEDKFDCSAQETPERPTSLPCQIHRITVKGEKWLVFVGLKEGYPFEVFAGKVDLVDIPSSITEGSIIKTKSKVYQLEHGGEILIKDIGKIFDSAAEESITRLISLHLKRRTPIYDLIEQLGKSYGTIIDFNKSVTRALKKYMKDRESNEKCPTCGANLVFQEGCLSCKSCGMSKCG